MKFSKASYLTLLYHCGEEKGDFLMSLNICKKELCGDIGYLKWRFCTIFIFYSSALPLNIWSILKVFISWLQAYSNLLRANMDGLKKKDKKSKNKKSKATQWWNRMSFHHCKTCILVFKVHFFLSQRFLLAVEYWDVNNTGT